MTKSVTLYNEVKSVTLVKALGVMNYYEKTNYTDYFEVVTLLSLSQTHAFTH